MEREAVRRRLDQLVSRFRRLRRRIAAEPALREAVRSLEAFQSARLAATYRDLLQDPRFRPAVEFFLSDLYGPQDLSARDDQILRALDKLKRFLPSAALDALARAFELQVMSLELDAQIAGLLPAGRGIEARDYAAAYRAAGQAAERERQISLIGEIGWLLDTLAGRREVGLALRLAHGPAHAAGYGELQDFLERGYRAFRQMDGAGPFLAAIAHRERQLMQQLFAGSDELDVGIPAAG